MKKTISARRQKVKVTPIVTDVVAVSPVDIESSTVSASAEQLQTMQKQYEQLLSEFSAIRIECENIKSALIALPKQLEKRIFVTQSESNTQLSDEISVLKMQQTNLPEAIEQHLCQIERSLSVKLSTDLSKFVHTIESNLEKSQQDLSSKLLNELAQQQLSFNQQLKNIGKKEFTAILALLGARKEEVDLERTISYQLGRVLIDGKKSVESLITLPNVLKNLRVESQRRKEKTLSVLEDVRQPAQMTEVSTALTTQSLTKAVQPEVVVEVAKPEYKDIIEKDYPLISYDFLKKYWPETQPKARFISILDEISENSWSNEFRLFPLNKNNYQNQIKGSTSSAFFIESCWKGNSGTWEYAFTSPGLKHANAQKLLDSLNICKERNFPVIFWNKEDPMHYDKFLPIAEKCDIIFTTDSNRVPDYKRDLPGKKVYPLVFAANPFICNPINRNRYPQETICFAGSYYSVGHDDRKIQMDQLLPALLEFNGAIYDRMSKLDNERYFFPEQYRHLIRDAVDFKTMSVLYKRFKIFLNVNTITDSPTMMSRRVYELLACGTPVISTPSLALEEQFPGIVQIASNAQEAVQIAKDLLQDEWKYKHLAHRGYREVMLKHTYQNRVKEILSSIDINYDDTPAKVSILIATMRENYIDRILENLGRQNYSNLELFVVTQGFSEVGVEKLKVGIRKILNIKYFDVIEVNDNKMTLGERLNKAASRATGEYLAKMDDDDFYFENYLTDMVIPFSYGNFGLVGKKEIFIYLESSDKTVLKYQNQSHRITDFVSGATLVIKKSIFEQVGGFNSLNRSEDSTLIEKIKELKIPIYAADPFNFIVWRSKNKQNHTWQVDEDAFTKNALEFSGFALDKAVV